MRMVSEANRQVAMPASSIASPDFRGAMQRANVAAVTSMRSKSPRGRTYSTALTDGRTDAGGYRPAILAGQA
jgi:hypothetical protein